MTDTNSVIAVLKDHQAAELAVKKLADAGAAIKHLSLLGQGYHAEESIIGFYNTGDRVNFWDKRGAFWGVLWGWLFVGLLLFIPAVGHVVVLGFLAFTVVASVEGAVVVGGLSAIDAALYGSGIPKDSVIEYGAAIKS